MSQKYNYRVSGYDQEIPQSHTADQPKFNAIYDCQMQLLTISWFW